jgi:hypothetical protein
VNSYEWLQIWANWANDVRGMPMHGGPSLGEENPDEVTAELHQFFTAASPIRRRFDPS